MSEPFVKSVEVPCSQEEAFNVFVDMGSWWPLEKFATSAMRGQSVETLRIDARVGGHIVEVGSDQQETVWGTFKSYDPFSYLNLDFHIPHPSEGEPGFTTVELRFTALGDDRTRVELTQSNWEGLGDVAEMAQGGYRGAWEMIFGGAYVARCGA